MRFRFREARNDSAPNGGWKIRVPARVGPREFRAALRRWVFRGGILLATAALLASVPATSQQDPDTRAKALVAQMTLDEKIEQLHGIHNDTQYRMVPGIPHLGIPDFHITNGPAGAGPSGAGKQVPATALPSPIALASTWDVNLAQRYGQIAGAEAKDIGNSLLEAPDINIARVPQNGRTFEGYGEDPFLAARLSVANITGIQSQGLLANVKHFAANNQESDRFVVNEIVDERTLREIYLPAFEASIKEGHSATVMCAYPRVNGTFACENAKLLDQVLRQDWGFKGFVISDFGATHSIVPAVKAGLDMEWPTGIYFGDALKAAVQSGELPEAALDQMLVHRFSTLMSFGLFDHPPAPQAIPAQKDGAAARGIAEAGMVLLKNSGNILPLHASLLKSLAVIGPYAGEANTGGGGSSHVVALYSVNPVDGIQGRVGPGVSVMYADGSDIAKAADMAKSADVAIVMVGDHATEGRDHLLTLEGSQDALIAAVAAANPHTIVVLKTGSAILMPWLDQVPGLLEAWYPGEEDGNAVAAVLFGDIDPSGKLPITFPKRVEDAPAHTPDQWPGVDLQAHYTEGVFVGYRYYDAHKIEPLFPFGFGLSYTTFSYDHLQISPDRVQFGEAAPATVTISCDVTNSGSVAGAEVAQLYLGLPSRTTVPEPPQQLKGFQKVALEPGQTAHVQFAVDARAVSYWDIATHAWTILPGTIHVMVGSSSRDIRLRGQFGVSLGAQ
ncbi:MAG: glycoside hydrolase family 3 C-terminal domain-containing protein [Candidatus Acidiferrales bacterium]